ncbi:MAG: hypothetical protein LH628_08100 [Microcoleus sp. CAN_BIN18]|nr:hypothetical protein [Microcoleus sp. CAN_BIN18]
MGELINLNPVTITEPQIPAAIARDAETAAAIAAHAALTNPHPIYLTQDEGDGRYRQITPLTDADIPPAIARDAEVASAIANHALHPVTRRADFGSSLSNLSGFYEGLNSLNAPTQIGGTNNWIHLIECRHSNPSNNFALQLASSFFDQSLYFRSLGNSGTTAWNKVAFSSEIASHEDNFHGSRVKLTVFTGVIAAVGSETIIGFGTIDFSKIVGINCYFKESMGSQGVRFVSMADSNWFGGLSPRALFGAARIPAVTASQLVGLPINMLVWHRE